ncbi:MAG: arsenite methyltransferase [Promethearchaeota archaeon]
MEKRTIKVGNCGCSGGNNEEISILNKEEQERREIREHYKNTAEGKVSEFYEENEELLKEAQENSPKLYSEEELKTIPEGANLGLGSGNPVQLAEVQPGETVVDLGSGAGVDCFLAANKVGLSGKVIGVDMTAEMIYLARNNAYKDKFENVEFRLGEIEHLPIADNTADVLISNCVINLSTDKTQVFEEAYRILKPGGRFVVSDIMFAHELPEKVKLAFDCSAGCVSRAEIKEDYLEKIRNAGFENVEIVNQFDIRPQKKHVYDEENPDETKKIKIISSGKKTELELNQEEMKIMETAIISAHVRAFKPI